MAAILFDGYLGQIEPATRHFVIVLRHLDAGPSKTLVACCNECRSATSERIEDVATFLANAYELSHQGRGLSGHVVLVGLADGLTHHAWQHRGAASARHMTLASPTRA